MAEQTGHCPYLGLKQNRAIRFASPTAEHRCYVNGEPIEIPVDQASFCLSQGHAHCPLYMGLSVPTMSEPLPLPVESVTPAVPVRGVRGWLATLSPRDRLIYGIMLGMLALIVAVYVTAGLREIFGSSGEGGIGDVSGNPTANSVAGSSTIDIPETPTATIEQEGTPPTPTALPTSEPTAAPTEEPTRGPLIIGPTSPLTNNDDPETLPGGTPTATPLGRESRPQPTRDPEDNNAAATPTMEATPTSAPEIIGDTEIVTLYFADATGIVYVPVERQVADNGDPLEALAVRELIRGPRGTLQPLLPDDLQLLDIAIADGTATVNFNQEPALPNDSRGYYALVFTLTEFEEVQRVQFQINGQDVGLAGSGPVTRPIMNMFNPDNLPQNYTEVTHLPLYFLSRDGQYDIRIQRLVPLTDQVAEATVRELLAGPGPYAVAVQPVIPENTELLDIRITDSAVVLLNFSEELTNANNRNDVVRTIVQSLTTLPNVRGVQIFVEGRSLGEQWGPEFGNVFQRPLINPQG